MAKPGLAHFYALGQVQGSAPSLVSSLGNQDSTNVNILPNKMSQMESQPQSKDSGFVLAVGLGQKEKAMS